MTNEEAKKIIFNQWQAFLENYIDYGEISEAYKLAIKALEQEPCEDCISRQAVLEQTYNWSKDEFLRVTNPFDYLRKRINSLPPVTPAEKVSRSENPKQRWIPVSEYGYPNPEDEYKHFLTVDNKGEITIQEFLLSIDEEPQPYFTGMRNITAWMPLPEPYKASPTGDEVEE